MADATHEQLALVRDLNVAKDAQRSLGQARILLLI
jgi:hypothetical protein